MREFFVILSSFYKNKKNKFLKKEKKILQKINKFNLLRNYNIKKLSTHESFSKKILEPISKVMNQVDEISAVNLSQRLTEKKGKKLGEFRFYRQLNLHFLIKTFSAAGFILIFFPQ